MSAARLNNLDTLASTHSALDQSRTRPVKLLPCHFWLLSFKLIRCEWYRYHQQCAQLIAKEKEGSCASTSGESYSRAFQFRVHFRRNRSSPSLGKFAYSSISTHHAAGGKNLYLSLSLMLPPVSAVSPNFRDIIEYLIASIGHRHLSHQCTVFCRSSLVSRLSSYRKHYLVTKNKLSSAVESTSLLMCWQSLHACYRKNEHLARALLRFGALLLRAYVFQRTGLSTTCDCT